MAQTNNVQRLERMGQTANQIAGDSKRSSSVEPTQLSLFSEARRDASGADNLLSGPGVLCAEPRRGVVQAARSDNISTVELIRGFTLDHWWKAREYLLPAIAFLKGTHTETDVVDMLIHGQLGLWLGQKCAGACELQIYPRMRVLHMFIAGGSLEEMLTGLPQYIEYARLNECGRISSSGRKGFLKYIPGAWSNGTHIFLDVK